MNDYWKDRVASSQDAISKRTAEDIEKQLKKYYSKAATKVIEDFEATYNKILATIEDDRAITPADLYKLDKYWKTQAQMRAELQKLGEKEVVLLTKAFEKNFFNIYNSIAIEGLDAYNTIDVGAVRQLLNSIWCADGKSWSARVWANTEALAAELNDALIHTVAAGRKATDLKNLLQERFGVSYSRANTLVRTELAHVQTQAAQQRYKDYGIDKVQVWADKDERRCDVCGELHKKVYDVGATMPIPAHPCCRCCIIPVVE